MWIVALLLILFFGPQFVRPKKKKNISLRPNCLLTKKPLVFLSGKSSPFYRGHYWNSIPHFLAAHGYKVIEVETPSLISTQSHDWAKNLFESLCEEFNGAHIFSDTSVIEKLHKLCPLKLDPKFTFHEPVETKPPKWWDHLYQPAWIAHTAFLSLTGHKNTFTQRSLGHTLDDETVNTSYLNFAINLAEKDYLGL